MSLKQEFELLRRVPIFAEIEPAKLKLLAFMSERVAFDPGKLLMAQGDSADAAFLIIEGHAEVIAEPLAGPGILGMRGAHESVGERGWNLDSATAALMIIFANSFQTARFTSASGQSRLTLIVFRPPSFSY